MKQIQRGMRQRLPTGLSWRQQTWRQFLDPIRTRITSYSCPMLSKKIQDIFWTKTQLKAANLYRHFLDQIRKRITSYSCPMLSEKIRDIFWTETQLKAANLSTRYGKGSVTPMLSAKIQGIEFMFGPKLAY
jgi:DNA-binding XRE family transcriptional regulator